MLRFVAVLGCVAMTMAFSTASHAGSVTDAVITKLAVNKQFGDIVFISVTLTKDSTPACHTNGSWTFVMPLTSEQDKKYYALLLAARTTQTPVTLVGTSTCDHFGSIESLQGIAY